MKRFLADAILICILVSIGSDINQQGSDDTRNLVQEQVESFESDVAQNRVVKAQNDPVALKDIEENRASQLAKSSSEAIVSRDAYRCFPMYSMDCCISCHTQEEDSLLK